MFATCLFCHSSLGSNQSIEHFPVGKRLAYDPDQGRLWAVCNHCMRWNLTPMEERWEAIEDCERAYRETRKRVSTDNIALARLADGTDLVRIGRPLLPEFAAWRYGEQLGVRRRRHILLRTLPTVWAGVAMSTVVIMSINGMNYAIYGVSAGLALQLSANAVDFLTEIPVAHVSVPGVGRLPMRVMNSYDAVVSFHKGGLLNLKVSLRTPRRVKFTTKDVTYTFKGDDASRPLSDVIVGVNHEGAKAAVTADAVKLLEEGATVSSLLAKVASPRDHNTTAPDVVLALAPPEQRLALEISLHEENERRAMAGELGALHARWEEAERVAKIADRDLTDLIGSANANAEIVSLSAKQQNAE